MTQTTRSRSDDSGRISSNQKPVENTAAGSSVSSEQSGSAGENNQPAHGDSTTSKASGFPSYQ
ncbi:unnamed protein product [Brassica rapa subsp. trilocularis]